MHIYNSVRTYIHIGPFSINSAGLSQNSVWLETNFNQIKKEEKRNRWEQWQEKVPRKSEKMPKYMPYITLCLTYYIYISISLLYQ